MKLHVDKCVSMIFSRSPSPTLIFYDHAINVVEEHTYLGIKLHKSNTTFDSVYDK